MAIHGNGSGGAEFQPRLLRQFCVGANADAQDDRVCLQTLAVLQLYVLDLSIPHQRLGALRGPELDTLLGQFLLNPDTQVFVENQE